MVVYRPVNAVVQLHFNFRWPQNCNATISLEHRTTLRVATLGINKWWSTTSLLVSPLNQMASSLNQQQITSFSMLNASLIPHSCSLLSHSLGKGWSTAWRPLSESVETSNAGSPPGSRVTMPCMKWTQRKCAVGVEGKGSGALKEQEQNKCSSREQVPPHNIYS